MVRALRPLNEVKLVTRGSPRWLVSWFDPFGCFNGLQGHFQWIDAPDGDPTMLLGAFWLLR